MKSTAIGAVAGESISYGYDTNGRRLSSADNRGMTTYAYEPGSDRISSITDPVTGVIAYTYDVSGARLTMTLPGGGTWSYTYGATQISNNPAAERVLLGDDPNKLAMNLQSITDDQGRLTQFAADFFGRPLAARNNETWVSGTETTYQEADYSYVAYGTLYQKPWLSQLKTIFKNIPNSTTATLAENDYALDNTGQRLTNAVTLAGQAVRTETYGYDPLNRLTTVNYGDGQTQGYGFDAMGNRLTKTDSVTGNESYAYNNANMLLTRTVGGTTTNYNNDYDGNTLAGTSGRVSSCDSQNRMSACTYNGTTSSAVYGADGIRRRSTVAGTSTDFVTDNDMMIREMRSGSSIATYLAGGQGPTYRRDDAAGTIRWYVYDGLGSVAAEVDATGAVTASRKYDVYGSVRSSTGVSTSKHKFVGQLGHTSDDETGLIYMRARYVDPVVGRFITEDPAGNGNNWFTYCRNSPGNLIDASGRSPEGWLLLAVCIMGSVEILIHAGFIPESRATSFVLAVNCFLIMVHSSILLFNEISEMEKLCSEGILLGVCGPVFVALVGTYGIALMAACVADDTGVASDPNYDLAGQTPGHGTGHLNE